MSYRDDFSADEWKTLQFSVLWVFHAIADVDGIIDEQEGQALLSAFKEELMPGNQLLQEVLASIDSDLKTVLESFYHDTLGVPMGLKTAAELVEMRLPSEVSRQFKLSLLFLGVMFAKMSDETPGESAHSRISEAEHAAILTVAAILRLSLADINL